MDPILAWVSEVNLNTVLGAVDLDLIEPEEGKFDLRFVDDLVQAARRHKLRLTFLWFES